jgi:protein-S-isoprenylcysteine O-methyltransferase Ste14
MKRWELRDPVAQAFLPAFVRSAEGNMRTFFIALRSLFFGGCFIGLWAWLALQTRVYDRAGYVLPRWSWWPGAILLLAGAVLAISCVVNFVIRGQGTPAPFDAPVKFVAVGPYRWMRNPMYIGGWLMMAGFGTLLRSPAVVAFSVVLWLSCHLFVLFYEEPTLRRKFGAEYEEYCRRVHRWLPGGSDSLSVR